MSDRSDEPRAAPICRVRYAVARCRGSPAPKDPRIQDARLRSRMARRVRTRPPMLPYACVCVPVLGVFIAGLLADRRYLGELRSMTEAAPSRLPAVTPRPVVAESARPAA